MRNRPIKVYVLTKMVSTSMTYLGRTSASFISSLHLGKEGTIH